jgi:hypothetical protein
MTPVELEKAILEQGLRSVNFFNGRLLTAHDLRREQEVRRTGDWRLGRALGDGVAFGLEVGEHPDSTVQEPLVTVTEGLAVNREGQTLRLTAETKLALVRKAKAAAEGGATFAQCGALQTGTYVAGPGVYLLTIAPATAREGKALTSGFDPYGGKCNTDAIVETVQFRLISIDASQLGLAAPAPGVRDESLFRNRLAMLCLGAAKPVDPFAPVSMDPVVKLAGKALSRCDVPLALLYWTLSGGIRFIDMWAVRRRLVKPSPCSDWNYVLGDRRCAEAEAMFLQFQEHIKELRSKLTAPQSVVGTQYFRYLPAAGVLTMAGFGTLQGFDYATFFQNKTYRAPVFIEGARVEALLRDSFAYPPVDLQSKEMIWLYFVRENRQAIDSTLVNRPKPYVIFANGHMPFVGEARFDLSKWNYGNHATLAVR